VRKKRHEEHANHERWLVSYADFITLLFAFFVVMFAISQVDAQKLGRFVESVNVAFELKGVFPDASPHAIRDTNSGTSIGVGANIAPPRVNVLPPKAPSKRSQRLQKSVQGLLGTALADKVRLRMDTRGVTVSLSEAGFFDTGSAVVRADSLATLREIGEALKEDDSPIAVEGHTDNVPIHTAAFPSNWELATARATAIVRYMIDEMHYDPARLSATGFAEFRPAGDNATAEGRGLNRRVDLVVLTEGSEGPPPR
jgi:chemotaxis protein MotB